MDPQELQKALGTQIGNQYFTTEQVNNPAYQEQIRQAVVGGGAISNNIGNNQWKDNITNQLVQAPQQYQPQVQQPSIADMIRQKSEANKASIAAQLQKTRDLAVGGYNQKIGGLQGTYQPLRDSQDFQGAKNVNATNEQMANMGITNSGDAITAQIQNRVGNENSLNSLDRQQQGDKTNFENLIANANNAYNSDLTSSNAGIDAQALNQLISQSNSDRSFNADQTQNTFNNGIATAGLTGMYNGAQTMQGQSNQSQLIGQNLNNDYQTLVNNGYPAQQATAMAQAKANLTGTNLQNDYQMLVSAGYPAQQAAELAQAKAQTAGQLLQNTGQSLSNTAQSIQNQYMPQTLQAAVNAQNRSNRSSSGGGGANGEYTKTEIGDQAWSTFINEFNNGNGEEWLNENSDGIIKNAGSAVYLKMISQLKTLPVSQKAQTIQYNDSRKQQTLDYNRQPM